MSTVHDKHRERVRKEFLERGFADNTPEHKILEMLLFYSIPRKDTNEIAHLLINRFGSLSNLLEADASEIMKVKGVGENTAALIKLILPLIRAYENNKPSSDISIYCMDEVGDFIFRKYFGQTNEIFSIACFDGKGELCGFDFLSSGDVASVGITSRMVIEKVLIRKGIYVVMAHNHPNGFALPSDQDLELTRMIANALNHINVKLVDHIIVGSDDYVSLKQSDSYKSLFN